MPDTMTIGRATQMSPETTHGQAPAGGATKKLVDLVVQMDPNFPVQEIRGTGRRFVGVVAPTGMELTAGKISGGLGYNSWVYPLSMMFGAAVVTTPAGAVNARQWQWTVPLTGSINPTSMDIEQGDTVDSEQFLLCVLDSLGIDVTRAGVTPAGTILARAINKVAPIGTFAGMTTSGVTTLPLAPVLADHWSIFMDSIAANIGSTKLLRAFHGKLDYGGAFVPFFPVDNALTSYGGVADGDQVKATFMFELMKDPAVGELLWTAARQGGLRRYLRLFAGGLGVSPLIDNIWTVATTGTPTGGTFTVTLGGVTSGVIQWNSTAAQLATVLQAMPNVGATGVTCTGGALPTGIVCTFAGPAQNLQPLALGTNSLSGGASPAPTFVATGVIPYSMGYDFAGEIQMPGPNKDFEGLRTREWTFTIVEDSAWGAGQAIVITVVNALTSGVL